MKLKNQKRNQKRNLKRNLMYKKIYCPVCTKVIGTCNHSRIDMIIHILQAWDDRQKEHDKEQNDVFKHGNIDMIG